ncbi:hypothetical protein HUG17_7982 [Dermatophagoides farinae]|uniref:RING-CH-type domain-containing protein n=1 Tax=Dermatophagoides farinae TaxID=6954 RepID=A0A9D4NWF9_DERFA|nr:hypothetical protein HUG17_7982 [Dermatophagoides farinae]
MASLAMDYCGQHEQQDNRPNNNNDNDDEENGIYTEKERVHLIERRQQQQQQQQQNHSGGDVGSSSSTVVDNSYRSIFNGGHHLQQRFLTNNNNNQQMSSSTGKMMITSMDHGVTSKMLLPKIMMNPNNNIMATDITNSRQSGQPLLAHNHHNYQYLHPYRHYRNGHESIRIGSSCISVHSAVSQASNDSSLLDYPANTPICKFCHQRGKANNPLISPCHCRGTIRYMHARCLMKWLDKLKRRNSRSQPLSCEICNYEYRWRKQFKSV